MKYSKRIGKPTSVRFVQSIPNGLRRMAVALIVCLFASHLTFAQDTAGITGKVTSGGAPVVGAGVIIKGTTIGVATDSDGSFRMEAPADAVLVVSSLGYGTREVPVNGKTYFEIELAVDAELLDDVVVVGYGVQKKVNLTGAVASVPTDELTGKPVANVSEAKSATRTPSATSRSSRCSTARRSRR